MDIIAYRRMIVKSSKDLINIEFITVCSRCAEIGFHLICTAVKWDNLLLGGVFYCHIFGFVIE